VTLRATPNQGVRALPETFTEPTQVTGLAATVLSETSVSLSWSASTPTDSTTIAGYRVYLNGAAWGDVSGLTATLTDLTAGTAYTAAVAAYTTAAVESDLSNSVGFTTNAEPEIKLELGTVTYESAAMTWNAVAGRTYRVYRVRNDGVTVTTVEASGSHTATPLLANTPYTFSVAEIVGGVEARASNEVLTTTPVAPTPDPDPTPGDTTAPTNPSIFAVPVTTAGTYTVYITVLSSFDAGGIDRYSINLNDQFNRTLVPDDFFSDAAVFQLGAGDGLSEGTEYVITVTAVDLAGNASETVGATFTTPTLTPAYAVATLGDASPASSAGINNATTGSVTMVAGGGGIGGAADSGGFAYAQAPGETDFQITARVASLTGGNPHGGVAIRETLATGSVMAAITVAADGVAFRRRLTENAAATGSSAAGSIPLWVRLTYQTGLVTAYTSANGSTWINIGSQAMTFNGRPFVGVVASSRANGTATTAAFDNFASVLTPPDTTAPSVPTLSATTTGTGSIRLDWTASTDTESGVREYLLTRNTVPIATRPFGVTTYTDTGLTAGTAYTYGIQAVDNAGNVSAEDTEIATTTAVASDLGTWLPIPEITVNAGFTGNVDTDLAPYYQPPSGQKLDSLAISSTNEAGGSVTASYPSGVTGSIVSNTTLRLACTSASAGSVSNLHVVPTISAISSSGGPGDTETDWATRIGGSGVFYSNNFSQYTSDAQFIDQHVDTAGGQDTNTPQSYGFFLRDATSGHPVVSGGKFIEIETYSNNGFNGGTCVFFCKGGARFNNFYMQVHISLNRAAFAWESAGTNGQCKYILLGGYGSGQVAMHMPRQQGFPGLFINGSTGVERVTGLDRYFQTGIDAGGGTPSTVIQGIQRFGNSRLISEGSSPLQNYSYVPNNAAANYLDARGFPFPNADALASGAVPFEQDDWLVVEMYYRQVPGGAGEFRMWAAPRGTAPKYICGNRAVSFGSLSASTLGTSGENAGGPTWIKLTNYDTPRISETGYRPTLRTRFAELIVSDNWIPFPGHLAGTEP
jgi:fibronectin type 3 domain-containing protein